MHECLSRPLLISECAMSGQSFDAAVGLPPWFVSDVDCDPGWLTAVVATAVQYTQNAHHVARQVVDQDMILVRDQLTRIRYTTRPTQIGVSVSPGRC